MCKGTHAVADMGKPHTLQRSPLQKGSSCRTFRIQPGFRTSIYIYMYIHTNIHIYMYGHALRRPPPRPLPQWSGKPPPFFLVLWVLVGLIGNPPPSFPPVVWGLVGGNPPPSFPPCIRVQVFLGYFLFFLGIFWFYVRRCCKNCSSHKDETNAEPANGLFWVFFWFCRHGSCRPCNRAHAFSYDPIASCALGF